MALDGVGVVHSNEEVDEDEGGGGDGEADVNSVGDVDEGGVSEGDEGGTAKEVKDDKVGGESDCNSDGLNVARSVVEEDDGAE